MRCIDTPPAQSPGCTFRPTRQKILPTSRTAWLALRRAAILTLLLGGALSISAVARTVSYPAPVGCATASSSAAEEFDPHELIARTKNGDIAYYRFGHGSPIVLQTGFRATIEEWNGVFLSSLAKRHEVIVFDNRGVGRSIPGVRSFSVQDMASDLATLIEALKLKHVTVLGWSMGGAVAAQLAIERPGALERLVLMSAPAPGSNGVPVSPDIEATFNDVMAVLFPSTALPFAEQCFRSSMFKPSDYKASTISADVTAGQAALLNAWSNDFGAASALRKVSLPTLLLTGEEDQVLPKQNSESLFDMVPHGRLLTVRAAGHAMMYQYPRELAQAVDRFISQTPESSNGG
jgi:pimeloyl-ACP methyl ester carboxylesterase